jgi:hypothetical protein
LDERDDMGTKRTQTFSNLLHASEDIVLLIPSVILDIDINTASGITKSRENLITVLKPNSHICKNEFRILGCSQLLEYLLNFNPYDRKDELYDSVPIIIINNTILTFLGPKNT